LTSVVRGKTGNFLDFLAIDQRNIVENDIFAQRSKHFIDIKSIKNLFFLKPGEERISLTHFTLHGGKMGHLSDTL
jgi:hypothetical protein